MYTISSNTWIACANALANINAGGALTYAGTSVYAFAGGGTTTFMRYSPATNTWATMAPAPVAVNWGGSLSWTGGDFIYALAGGDTGTFLRYTISTNTWTTMPAVPQTIAEGGALTYGGGSFLIAVRGGSGGGGKDSYRYDVTASTWTKMADTQNPTSAGGALTWDRNTFLYELRGGGTTAFWRYTIGANTWTTAVAPAPGSVGAGGSLAYAPATGGGSSCFASPGSIASIVFDTTTANSRWDMLAWNASVPAGTAITMEVRSSNTLFLVDDPTIPWATVTGTLSGGWFVVAYPDLPSGRYHQWRATLTSTVCESTPVLQDVTVYFSDWITPIAALGGLLSPVADLVGGITDPFESFVWDPPYDPYGIDSPPTVTAAPPKDAANATATPAGLIATEAPASNVTPLANTIVTATTTAPANLCVNTTPTPAEPPAPNATTPANATVTATPTDAAALSVNATATPVETPTPNATDNATPPVTVVEPSPASTPAATATMPPPNGTVEPVVPEPTVTATPTETPTPPTLMEVAGADRNLTTFVALARDAGLNLTLDGPGPFTVFAPTDEALRLLPPSILDRIRSDPVVRTSMLNRHVALGAFDQVWLADMPALVTLDGALANVTVRAGTVAIENASVNYTAAPAANGVLHAIDAVILPVLEPAPSPTLEATVPAPVFPTGTTAPVVPADLPATVAPRDTITMMQSIAPQETTVTDRATTPRAKYRPDAAG